MIRRAKTKFKPVVRKPAAPTTKDVHMTSPKPEKVVYPEDSRPTNVCNLKSTADNHVQSSTQICAVPDVVLGDENPTSSTHSESQEVLSKAKPQTTVTRRRKLVAMPQTTRKKTKLAEEKNEMRQTPNRENIESGVVMANAIDRERMESNLDGGNQKNSFETENSHVVLETDEVPVVEPNLIGESCLADNTAATTVILSSPNTDGSREIVLSSPQSVTTSVVVELSREPKKSIKTESKIQKHRQHAMQKLDMLKRNSNNDKEEWPEIDHNLLSMSDLIFINPPVNVGLTLGMNHSTKEVSKEEVSTTTIETENTTESSSNVTETTEEGKDKEESSALPVPQIRVAEDGTVVVDEDSLVLDTQKPVNPNIKAVYEDSRDLRVTQTSFLRRPHAKSIKWTKIDTDKFYHCLGIVGAEFSLMRAMFRTRGADDLRRKYRRERKTNPSRVDNALKIQHLSKWTEDMFELAEETDSEKISKDKEDLVT